MLKRYFLYLLRWQASTPILAAFVWLLTDHIGAMATTILANLVGGLIFFWIDKMIFKQKDFIAIGELWEIKPREVCVDCGLTKRGYRLIKSKELNYDRSEDKNPKFRCRKCSAKKYGNIKADRANYESPDIGH
ncbi:MAG: hypothetical protein JXR70_01730 [Spirochaetales bacterium]|nr:hypothetical protein [Spirochaetales bacterium]